MAVSQQDIQSYINDVYNMYPGNPQAANAVIAQAMDQYGVSPQQVASAMGANVSEVQNAYNTVAPSGSYNTVNAVAGSGSTADSSVLNNPSIQSAIAANSGITTNALSTPSFNLNPPQSFTNDEVYAYIQNEIVAKQGLQPGTDAFYKAVGDAAVQFRVPVSQLAPVLGLSEQQISQYAVDNGLNLQGIDPNVKKSITPLAPLPPAAPVTGEGVTTQIVREAPEIEAYKLGLLQQANQLYSQGLNLPEYQIADPSEGLLQSYDIAQQGIGTYKPYIEGGAQAIGQAQNLAQDAATMGQLGLGAYLSATGQYTPGQNIGQFMNPYQQLVTDEALRQIRRQADIAGQGQAAQAVKAGAFGGTREGVQRAEMERNVQDIMSQRIAQDLAQNYGQALQAGQSAYEAQQARAIGAGQGISGLTGTYGALSGQLGQLGVQQAALGQAAQQGLTSDVNMMNVLGNQQQQYAQSQIEAQRMTDLQRELSPYQQLSFVSDIYKGAPSSQSSLVQQSVPQTSPFLQAAGLGISGLAAATGAQKAGLFG